MKTSGEQKVRSRAEQLYHQQQKLIIQGAAIKFAQEIRRYNAELKQNRQKNRINLT